MRLESSLSYAKLSTGPHCRLLLPAVFVCECSGQSSMFHAWGFEMHAMGRQDQVDERVKICFDSLVYV